MWECFADCLFRDVADRRDPFEERLPDYEIKKFLIHTRCPAHKQLQGEFDVACGSEILEGRNVTCL